MQNQILPTSQRNVLAGKNIKNKEITELVPNDSTNEFEKKFRLNNQDTFVFFIKNEQEYDSFPELSETKIKFVMWKKTNDKSHKNIIYLDESRDNLIKLINSL